MTITARQFRDVTGQFPTGVTVVGIPGEGGPHAVTVNSFVSVSLDPAMVLICLRNGARSEIALRSADSFSINILAHDQARLVGWFASSSRPSGPEGFAGIPYSTGETGSPLLDGAAAYLDCRRVRELPAGDHTIFLGAVVDLATAPDRAPLVFHQGDFYTTA